MSSSRLISWCPLLLLSSVFPSIRDFYNESSVPIWWSFSFSISPSSKYSGLISLKIVWFDLLAVQGTFRSLLQHHSLKASILWHSAFFMVQFSQPHMTTGRTIWTFAGRVMSLLFNTLSRFVIAFLPKSNCLLISWLQSLSSDFGAQGEEMCQYSHLSSSICHAVLGLDAMILFFFFLTFSLKLALTLLLRPHQEAL